MSCDLVTFPFFGAFAPCSDKQLKKKTHKHQTLGCAELNQGSADRTEVETIITQFCNGMGCGDGGVWDKGQSRIGVAVSPTSNALGWCVLARSSAVNHEGPHGEPQARLPWSSAPGQNSNPQAWGRGQESNTLPTRPCSTDLGSAGWRRSAQEW